MSLFNSENFSIYLSPPFLYLLSANYFMRDCTLHAPYIIMNAFLLPLFSVENKMPGGYWSRTGTADLSGALLHQKNGTVQCRSTLAVGETEIWDPSH